MPPAARRALAIALLAVVLGAGGARAWRAHEAASIDGRLARFDPAELSPVGRRAYAGLLEAELVEDTFRSWTFESVRTTYWLLDLWDEPPEASTRALLALCERGTPAARFYALAGLSQSDPWTFRRAVARYGDGERELSLQLGCFHFGGTDGELVRDHLVEAGGLAEGWRGVWSRTVRRDDGPDPWRDLRE